MPAVTRSQAVEELASAVEIAKPDVLRETHDELFPENKQVEPLSAKDLAQFIRTSLAAEEIVALWNVVFPSDHNVWYNEVDETIHYNEEMVGYADPD